MDFSKLPTLRNCMLCVQLRRYNPIYLRDLTGQAPWGEALLQPRTTNTSYSSNLYRT